MPPDPSRLREALLIAREQIAKQQAIIEAQNALILYAYGDGPGPIDEEAERAAWGWLRVAVDAFGPIRSAPFFRRVKGLLTTRCPDHGVTITIQWAEAIRRLREAAELRASVGRMRQAMRRAMGGDRVGTIRALRGAVDVFGEPRASAPVELQWRIAELEVEERLYASTSARLNASSISACEKPTAFAADKT